MRRSITRHLGVFSALFLGAFVGSIAYGSVSGGGLGAFMPFAHAGTCGATGPIWFAVAAGGSITVLNTCGDQWIEALTTGALDTVNLPASCTDGQTVTLKMIGASNPNGVAITPGASQALEDPNNPGTFLATAATATVRAAAGSVLGWKCDASNTRWVEFR